MKELVFENKGIELTCREDNGNLFFEYESVAKQLGWTKNGGKYVRKDKMNDHLEKIIAYDNENNDCPLMDKDCPKLDNGDFIPEQYVYMLTMKANTKMAMDFQWWLSSDVVPKIRRNGEYTIDDLKKYARKDLARKEIKNVEDGELPKLKETLTTIHGKKEAEKMFIDMLPKRADDGRETWKMTAEIYKKEAKELSKFKTPDEWFKLVIKSHPISFNKTSKDNSYFNEKRENFKQYNAKYINIEKGTDTSKPMEIYIRLGLVKVTDEGHLLDTDNYGKVLQDFVASYLEVNDSLFEEHHYELEKWVNNFKDGYSKIYIRNRKR